MGLGLLGRGVNDAKFFVEQGAEVTVTDLKTKSELSSSLKELAGLPINFVLGKHREQDFKDQDLILRGAGVPRNSKYIKIAKENNIPIEMDESLFAKNCPCPIIGVTGTRGKTTTTILIYEILKRAFDSKNEQSRRVFLGGNIKGMATLPFVDQVDKDSLVVLELSSWQLQGFDDAGISPKYSLITNIFPDHLDKYIDMEEYINDKKVIFKYQQAEDYLFLNSDDQITSKFYREAKSKIVWFSRVDVHSDFQVNLLGKHNLSNIAAAIKVCQTVGVDYQTIKSVVAEFKGVDGRLELAAQLGRVKFINDTTSTTPVAGEAALDAFKDENIILITGGADKKLDFKDFAQKIITQTKKTIFLEGEGTKRLLAALDDLNYKKEMNAGVYDSLSEAVKKAYELAREEKGIVLFSPACSSFGLFDNEYDRGEKFVQAVKELRS